jgi:hypothetical protein
VVAGCGGDEPDATGPSPLSDEQAQRLANVLFDNLDSGGATFAVESRGVDGSTISLRGEVDWVDHRGHAEVRATGVEADLVEIYWTETEVLERRSALNAELRDAENLAVEFVARPPSASRQLDRLVSIVSGLAGEQRDNPLLITQQEGSAFLRADELRGVPVDVLRYGEHNLYWLDRESGGLLRFEEPGTTTGQPLVVDVIERGPQSIAGPAAAVVIPAAEIADRYPFPLT